MRNFTKLSVVGLLALVAAAPGCAAEEEMDATESGISKPELRARFADLRNITTQQFSSITVNEGAKALNSALKLRANYRGVGVSGGIHVNDTLVYAKDAETNSFVSSRNEVKSITEVQKNLAAELGENEFPTKLAQIRLKHLGQGQDKYYVETGFEIDGAFGADFTHVSQGFGDGNMSVSIGFKKGKALKSRVLVATPEANVVELLEANGEAIGKLRERIGGFVIPENAEQITKMKPGESFGVTGEGTTAVNFGLGVPILIGDAGPFAYRLAVSGSIASAVTGKLDVELVRLEGDEVAIDVGMTEGTVDERSIGIYGGWGINEDCVEEGGSRAKCLDGRVGDIVKSALLDRLRGFMKTSVRYGSGEKAQRIELSRIRLKLGQPEVSKAIELALHGDLRLAQALYARNLKETSPPVVFDFDAVRATTTNYRAYGAQIFGLNIFAGTSRETTGSFAVQTPDGVQSVLWQTFEKTNGYFQMESGSKLTPVSTTAITSAAPDKVVNRANLIVQAVVGDRHMDDDVLLDSADSLIASLAGVESLAVLDTYGKAMQVAVGEACPVERTTSPGDSNSDREKWDEKCNVDLLANATAVATVPVGGTPKLVSLIDARTEGVKAFSAQANVRNLPAEHRDLVISAAELRLTLQMVKIHAIDTQNGPGVSFAVNYRLDDKALQALANVQPEAVKAAAKRYFSIVGPQREGIKGGVPISDADAEKGANAMAAAFQRFKDNFRNVAENESTDLPRILGDKPWVRLPIGVRFDVSNVQNPDSPERMEQYVSDMNRIRVESLSYQRSIVAKTLFDALEAAADDTVRFRNSDHRLFKSQAAAYTLLALLPANNLEVGMDVAANTDSTFWQKRERFQKAGFAAIGRKATGPAVEPIGSNLFDIRQMLDADPTR